jgi:protease-4
MNKKALPIAVTVLLLVFTGISVWASDPQGDAKFRADDATIWHVGDNPAMWGLGNTLFAYGLQYAPVDSRGTVLSPYSSGPDSLGVSSLVMVTPLLNFSFTDRDSTSIYKIGATISPVSWFSVGMQTNCKNYGATTATTYDFGLLLRPADLLSIGVTGNDAFDTDRSLGLGLGLRPLALFTNDASCLTLTADSHFDSNGFTFETAGVHLNLGSTLSLRGWWDFANSRPGAELDLTFGAATFSTSAPLIGDPWGNVRAGFGAIVTKGGTEADYFGRKILMLRDYDAIEVAPPAAKYLKFPWDKKKTIDIESLCALVRRAASDRSVVAVVFEDLPSVGYPAARQELASAIDALRKAGKKLYVYCDDIESGGQYESLFSEADSISLNPNGSLALMGSGGVQLYMKQFFDKLGIRFINLALWDTKSAYNPYTNDSMPAAERQMIQRYIDELQSQADATLVANRGSKLKAPVKELVSKGPYLTASPALEAGLVDHIEYRADFEDSLSKEFKGAKFVENLGDGASSSWGSSPFAKKVAVVWLSGNIVAGKGRPGVDIGQDAARSIKRLREDRSVAGILLRVDSGGGSAMTSDIIANEVKKTVAAGKPVVVSMGGMAASGGYYISAYASRIFASPGTITGSIGVTGLWFNLSGLEEKLGFKAESVVTSPSVNFMNPLLPMNDADVQAAKSAILSMYERFVSTVAEGRKLDPAKVRELGEGQIWIGREALANGLVDELGGLSAAKDWLAAKLGGRVQYRDVFPGTEAKLDGSTVQLASAAYAAASESLSLPRSSLYDGLERIVGPAAKELASMIDMGDGPLYFAAADDVQ